MDDRFDDALRDNLKCALRETVHPIHHDRLTLYLPQEYLFEEGAAALGSASSMVSLLGLGPIW